MRAFARAGKPIVAICHGPWTLIDAGYSERLVVSKRFVIRIPPGANLPATAPLLCAGITTFVSTG